MGKALNQLHQFTGSETFWRHALNCEIVFTEGTKYVADTAGAYWLIDDICLAQKTVPALQGEEFQVWKLDVATDSTAELYCEDGNGRVIHIQHIALTDFPREGITLWLENSTLYLPSER